MTSYSDSFEWDQWRGHPSCLVAKHPAAQLVCPTKSQCQRKGDAHSRGSATTDLSQALPELRQTEIFTTHQIALSRTPRVKRQDVRSGDILYSHDVQPAA